MIALVAAAIAELCTPVSPSADAPDAAAADAYVAVGDTARAAGDTRVAATAYRKALLADPANAHARGALDALCATDRATQDEATLLGAIAAYQRGDYETAQRTLETLVARGAALASNAHLFLGLIALAHHDGSRAADELELAARDPLYAETTRPLLRQAHRDGPLAALVLVAQEIDSNPQLLPDTPPIGAMTGPPQTDGDLLAAATVTWRPTSWSFVRDLLSWREQYQLRAFDFFGNTTEAGVDFRRGVDQVTLAYTLEYDLLAAAPYLIGNGALLSYRHDLSMVSIVTSYALRQRDFRQAMDAGFTGWAASADAGVVVHATPRVDLEARALGLREFTADSTFSDYAAGVRVAARLRLGSRARLSALATGWYATYDAPEPDGTQRNDLHGELGLDAEYDLGDYVLATCAAQVIDNQSSVLDFVYSKLVARCGFAVAWGGP